MSDLQLVEPSMAWEAAFLEMAAEYAATGNRRYQAALDDFAGYLRNLQQHQQGENLPPGRVRETTYWGALDSSIVGTIRLRYELTPWLHEIGGHIGYEVRPSRRRRGYATQMLALTLEHARQAGLPAVLITCDADNYSSARVIEKNGGALAYQGIVADYPKPISRYWIDLPAGL